MCFEGLCVCIEVAYCDYSVCDAAHCQFLVAQLT